MAGLANSRWAGPMNDRRSSSTPPDLARLPQQNRSDAVEGHWHPNGPANPTAAAASELDRYSKIVRRMKWKLPFLDTAYRHAVSYSNENSNDIAEAVLMFKLDFFEYYMLCERALVHLQGVFGVVITPGINATGSGRISSGAERPKHRYHANVLAALDRKDNPLHSVLGVGEIRTQLAIAKDLRNHWKNADLENDRDQRRDQARPLASYNLSKMLAVIHSGLDRAFTVASNCASSEIQHSRDNSHNIDGESAQMDIDVQPTEEEEWGFMVEAMDWEAV